MIVYNEWVWLVIWNANWTMNTEHEIRWLEHMAHGLFHDEICIFLFSIIQLELVDNMELIKKQLILNANCSIEWKTEIGHKPSQIDFFIWVFVRNYVKWAWKYLEPSRECSICLSEFRLEFGMVLQCELMIIKK